MIRGMILQAMTCDHLPSWQSWLKEVPFGKQYKQLLKMVIEIVDLPI